MNRSPQSAARQKFISDAIATTQQLLTPEQKHESSPIGTTTTRAEDHHSGEAHRASRIKLGGHSARDSEMATTKATTSADPCASLWESHPEDHEDFVNSAGHSTGSKRPQQFRT